MLKLVVSALLAVTLMFGPLAAVAAELKIGVVDPDSILMNSPAGKWVQDSIKKKAEELGKPLGTKRQDIGRQMEEFQKQASMMKEDARKTKGQELEKKIQEFRKAGGRRRKTAKRCSSKVSWPRCPRRWKAPWNRLPRMKSWI